MVLDRSLTNVEHEVVPAAEAMPEDKFNFAPTQGEFKGVRTFAQQVKHIAAVNYMLAGAILGEKPPVDLEGENGPAKITSKADVVQFLKDSFAYLHKALNSIDENNVLGQVPELRSDPTRCRGSDLRSSPSATPSIITARWWNICA